MVIGTVARLAKATVYFGAQEIFGDLSWEIYHDARIGLVGPNGAGKSSILKLFAGEMETSEGLAQITKLYVLAICPRKSILVSTAPCWTKPCLPRPPSPRSNTKCTTSKSKWAIPRSMRTRKN